LVAKQSKSAKNKLILGLETAVPFKHVFHSLVVSGRRFVSAMAPAFSIRSVPAPSPATAWFS
jgi:hypothetical protein